MNAWHYTIALHVESIVADGLLHVTGLAIDPEERPALWFSKNQYWEPTACKGGARTMRETARVGGGLVRFGVDASSLVTWEEHKRSGGITPKTAAALEATGYAEGSHPRNWLVSYDPIDIGSTRIEILNGHKWAPMPVRIAPMLLSPVGYARSA